MSSIKVAQAHDHHHHAQKHRGESASAAPPSACEPATAAPVGVDAYRRFTADMHGGMERMMRDMHSDAPSGDPDIDFLVMMIPHHAGAVDMARLVLRAGRDPLVREIAEKILASQLAEIDGMRGRLAALKQCEPAYPSLTGNRGL
jgi:hypothetical protein